MNRYCFIFVGVTLEKNGHEQFLLDKMKGNVFHYANGD